MLISDIEIIVTQGDITQSSNQAIVNAANNQFQMGGGVALAIKKKGGQTIEDEAKTKGPVEVGESIITSAGSLPAEHIIHAATMAMDFKIDYEIIRRATYSALTCAQDNNISSISFCALGCGTGGVTHEVCAKIMGQEVFRYIREVKGKALKKIEFVLFSKEAYNAFEKNIHGYIGYISKKLSEGPFLTVDGIVEYKQGIIMIERSNPPFGWALPGGFVDYGESLETSVVREIKEETNLEFKNIKLLKVCSKYGRDPRFHTVTAIYTGIGTGELLAGDDAKNAIIVTKGNLPDLIAFDHQEIIEDYFNNE